MAFSSLRSLVPIVVFLLPTIFFIWEHAAQSCNMASNLEDLLSYTVRQFNKQGIEYWLDYGTALGLVRDGGIIPFEFDVDLGTKNETCDDLLQLKELFRQEKGYQIYGRRDYIPQKGSLIAGNANPYLEMPCARIYDENLKYYVDIYWYVRVTPEMVNNGLRIFPPLGYNVSDPGHVLRCNLEGFDGSLPGGCQFERDFLPVQYLELYGIPMPVAKNAPAVLRNQYGPTWTIRLGKGYKAFCQMPHLHILGLQINVLLYLAAIIITYLIIYALGFLFCSSSLFGSDISTKEVEAV